MSRYTVKTPISVDLTKVGTDFTLNAIVSFTVDDDGVVEITKFQLFMLAGVELDCPDWLSGRFGRDTAFQAWLIDEAKERDEIERDAAADQRAA